MGATPRRTKRPTPARPQGRATEERVYRTLRDEIERGLAPGTPLRLETIATRLGVSTMPVRAALGRLAADGLVRTQPRRGTTVAPLSLDDIEEIQAIRWGIEGLAARLGADAATDATRERMRAHLADLEAAAARGDTDAYLEATYALEDTCYLAAGRPRLVATVRSYRRAALRYVRLVVGTIGDLEVEPARVFLDAAERNDGAAAERLIQQQVMQLLAEIADGLAAGPALSGQDDGGAGGAGGDAAAG